MDTTTEREAIVRLYAAAAGEGSWARALEPVAEGVGATTVVLLAQPPRGTGATMLGAVGLVPEAQRTLRECCCARRGAPSDGVDAPPGTAGREARTASRSLIVSGEAPQVTVWLAAFRLHSQAAFDTEHREAFGALAPHLQQAMCIAMARERANDLWAATQAVGEQLGKALAVLDAHSRVVLATALFDRICASGDGLTVRNGVLTTSRLDEPAFSRLLARALRGGQGGRLAVLRASGGPPYSLLVSPMAPASPLFGTDGARVSVLVSDPAMQHATTEDALSVAYGLTRAESRMVSRLVAGTTVCATAEQLGISLNTARTHLKRAMAKTGVSRQTDLVRLVLTRQ